MIRTYPSISISLGADQVLGHLYPPGADPAQAERRTRVTELATWAAARVGELGPARGVFRRVELEGPADWPPTARGELLFAGLATLGPALDDACRDLWEAGQDSRALFLEAAGAVAVEAACDSLEAAIAEICEAEGLRRTRRASPGYGAFPLTDQQRLFDLLPAADLGVTLTAECLMVPLKSVSFVILAGTEPALIRADLTCEACALLNCPHRRPTGRCVYQEDEA